MHGRLLVWSLRHRRWRHVLNALTMAITVAVLIMFVSVMTELIRVARINAGRDFERILVWPKVVRPGVGFPIAVTQTLAQIPGVKVVQSVKNFSGKHPSGATYFIAGEEVSGVELGRDHFPVATDVIEAWKQDRTAAIVTEETAQELGLKVGQSTEIPSTAGPLQIKVVGISYNSMFAHRIVIHFEYAQEHTKSQDTASSFRVITAPADMPKVAKEIIERTKNTATPAQAFSDAPFMSSWVRQVALVPTLLGFLGLFLLCTTALTLANSTAIAIRERRTETATMRVIGFRRSTIIRSLLGEALLVGLAGGLLAVAVSALVFRSGVQLTPGAQRLLQAVTITPFAAAVGIAVSLIIPLVGALPVALVGTRMPLVDALRDKA